MNLLDGGIRFHKDLARSRDMKMNKIIDFLAFELFYSRKGRLFKEQFQSCSMSARTWQVQWELIRWGSQ